MSNPKVLKIKKEFQEIMQKTGGFLSPEDVVKYAKNKKTALHSQFCWDDTEAAHKYRLHQAGDLIRSVKVEISQTAGSDKVVTVREYVSLPGDRNKSGGYRHITQILSEDDLMLQYIESVQAEFEAIRNKLKTVSELAYKKSEAVQKEIEKQRRITANKAKTARPAM